MFKYNNDVVLIDVSRWAEIYRRLTSVIRSEAGLSGYITAVQMHLTVTRVFGSRVFPPTADREAVVRIYAADLAADSNLETMIPIVLDMFYMATGGRPVTEPMHLLPTMVAMRREGLTAIECSAMLYTNLFYVYSRPKRLAISAA